MRIATLNVRNTADRWRQRRHLLVGQLVDLAPDVLATQELRIVPDQAAWLIREVERRSGRRLRYRSYRRPKTGLHGLWEGIGVLSRLPVVAVAWLDLGVDARVAQRVTVHRPDGGLLDLYNTHFGGIGEERRCAQARRVLEWMDARPPLPVVLVGDLNARPGSPTVDLVSSRLRSAHVDRHQREPARTVPTPLRVGYTGDGAVLDYVFVNDLVEVHDAGIVFDQLGPADPTLAASDHYGLAVTVTARATGTAPRR